MLEKTTGGQLGHLSAHRKPCGFVQLSFENLQGWILYSLSVSLLRLSHLRCEILDPARIFLAAAHVHCLLFFCCVPLRRICFPCSICFSLWQSAGRFILCLLQMGETHFLHGLLVRGMHQAPDCLGVPLLGLCQFVRISLLH